MNIRVLHVGLGPIGATVARQVRARQGLISVGGVDLDPAKAGRALAEVLEISGDGSSGPNGTAQVYADLSLALKETRPDIVVLCTSSALARVLPQIETVLSAGVPIVSTTEELSYPVEENAALAARIHALAVRAGVAVLGTGVNPGFVMDSLPLTLTGVCESVQKVEIDRIQEAGQRRLPFQQKIGAGLDEAEFRERVARGSVRHVGLSESITMIADRLGWKLDRITDDIEPRLAAREVSSQYLTVPAGKVCGLIQDGVGYVGGEARIVLHMEAYLGAPESFDAVRITGSPNLNLKLEGGVQGDVATASIVVNSIPKVLAAGPGLQTMADLPIATCYPGHEPVVAGAWRSGGESGVPTARQ